MIDACCGPISKGAAALLQPKQLMLTQWQIMPNVKKLVIMNEAAVDIVKHSSVKPRTLIGVALLCLHCVTVSQYP
jgi:hypothetical protein